LIAFDPLHDAIRVFSVERIRSVKESEEKFVRPADFNLNDYLNENCFNGIHGKLVTVKLKTTGITARIFAERKFHPSQKIIERKQRRGDAPEIVTIEMQVAGGRGLIRFILSHLPNIEVISPPEIKREVRKVLEASRKNFG
jgi:predicted DNA-binding transcriptional regulator YafY